MPRLSVIGLPVIVLSVIVVLALSVASAGTARATIVSGAFSGVIGGNIRDTYGLFDSAGSTLSGETLHATYRYNTATAFSYAAQATSDDYLGTDNLTLSVTIGSATVTTSVVSGCEIIDQQDGAFTTVTLANFAPTPLIAFDLVAQGAWVAGVTIDTPLVLDPSDDRQTLYLSADGSHYDMLTFSGVTAAPEPGSLAAIAAGLAALGGVTCKTRRQRRPQGGITK